MPLSKEEEPSQGHRTALPYIPATFTFQASSALLAFQAKDSPCLLVGFLLLPLSHQLGLPQRGSRFRIRVCKSACRSLDDLHLLRTPPRGDALD